MAQFVEKVIIVTGASSGIGQATAEAFAKHGAYLVITGRNKDNLAKVANNCRQNGAKDVLQIIAEFSNLLEVEKIVEKALEKFKKLDVLVNNAGVMKSAPLQDVKMDDFDLMFNVNVKAVMRLTQLAMPYLVETKGNIVNVSSISGQRQFPTALIYGMTKAALDQFTKTVALEYAPRGVRVNAVNPSNVKTDLGRYSFPNEEHKNKFYSQRVAAHPIGRIGTIEEVAAAILFLASDSSSWTTGQCLTLDGGRCLTGN